jgi:hypothetical protein
MPAKDPESSWIVKLVLHELYSIISLSLLSSNSGSIKNEASLEHLHLQVEI